MALRDALAYRSHKEDLDEHDMYVIGSAISEAFGGE